MKFKLIYLSWALMANADPAMAESHIRVHCMILSHSSQLLKKFPGYHCNFLESGSVVVADQHGLAFIDKFGKELWRKKLHGHHMLNLDHARKQILLISSELKDYKGKKNVIFDVLRVLDFAGNIKKEFKLFAHKQFHGGVFPYEVDSFYAKENAKFDGSHVNSFYEIPPNDSKLSFMRAGNYIVNELHSRRIFILDAQLKNILWEMPYTKFEYKMLHDVQVLQNGNLLWFNNIGKIQNEGREPFSSLEEYDPKSDKIVWTYSKNPQKEFYMPQCGGVQLLADRNILFSDYIGKKQYVTVIDRSGKIISSVGIFTHVNEWMQDAKYMDLGEFLQNNQAL